MMNIASGGYIRFGCEVVTVARAVVDKLLAYYTIFSYTIYIINKFRKMPIYGNCQVHSPDGELMFRCLEKRAKWYLDRKLAVITNDNPLSIKLTFTPKGKGETMDVLKMERQNKCVVCGTADINNLTKHHLVPFVYRQHFPEKRKKHSSLFVLPICRDCHLKYENNFAIQLKNVLAEAYSAPINGTFDKDKDKTLRILRCLIQFSDRIPEDRKEFLRNQLRQQFIDFGMTDVEKYNLDLLNISILETLQKELEKESKSKINQCHGKTVVDRIKDFDEFEKMWAKHFVDHMQPKYMPEYLLKTICNFVSQSG